MVLDRGDLGVYISNISQGSSDVFPPQWRNYEGGGGTVKHVLPLGCPAPPLQFRIWGGKYHSDMIFLLFSLA